MIKSLTSLRGIFILFVFFHHCASIYPGGGSLAVTFFFVLSGFGLTLGYHSRIVLDSFNYKQYLLRRFIKFFPLHWLCLLLAIPLVVPPFNWEIIPIFFANAALIHAWIPIRDVYFSFNAVSWYLADVIFFAVVFPYIFKWIHFATLKSKVSVSILLAALYSIVVLIIPADKFHAVFYISPYMRLMDFIFGIYLAIAYLYLKERPIRKWNNTIERLSIIFLIAFLILISCLLKENEQVFAPVYWVPLACLILISSLSERFGGGNLLDCKLLNRLGEMSFTIFMVHQIVIRYMKLLFDEFFHYENYKLYVLLTLALTIGVSSVVDKFLLNPITQWLTKRIQPSMTARS